MSEDNKQDRPFSRRDWLSIAGVAGLFALVVGWGSHNYEERLKEQEQQKKQEPDSQVITEADRAPE